MENWKFALSSIMGHKMRSFLTTLGIIIGVASVVVIMALGEGMTNQVTNMFASDNQNIQIYYTTKKSDDILMMKTLQRLTKDHKLRKSGCKKSQASFQVLRITI